MGIERAFVSLHDTSNNGDVHTLWLALFELLDQPFRDRLLLSEYEQAADFAIESMNEASRARFSSENPATPSLCTIR